MKRIQIVQDYTGIDRTNSAFTITVGKDCTRKFRVYVKFNSCLYGATPGTEYRSDVKFKERDDAVLCARLRLTDLHYILDAENTSNAIRETWEKIKY